MLLIFFEYTRLTMSLRKTDREEYQAFLVSLAESESGGDHSAINQFGYIGLYQMGEAALHDIGVYKEMKSEDYYNNDWSGRFTGKYGIDDYQAFMKSPDKQTVAITAYHRIIDDFIEQNELHVFIGRNIGGIKVTKSGMIAGGHLVGMTKMRDFLHSEGRSIPKDGNGFPITYYMKKFGDHDYNNVPG